MDQIQRGNGCVWQHITLTKIKDSHFMPNNREMNAGIKQKNRKQTRSIFSINPILPILSTICHSKSHADVLFMVEIPAAHVPSS